MSSSLPQNPTRIFPSSTPRSTFDVRAAATRLRQSLAGTPLSAYATRPLDQRQQREQTILVNDISYSMEWMYDAGVTKLQASMRASCNMVLQKDRIDPADEIGLIVFCRWARLLLPLCDIATHKKRMLALLQTMEYGPGTDIAEGLKLAYETFDWQLPGVVRRVALLTDGQGGHPLPIAQSLKSWGVIIDVVGVGATPAKVDEPLLKQIASTVDGQLRYRFIGDQETLLAHYTQLAGKTNLG